MGPTSCGKTGLATILLAEAIAAGGRGCWVRSQGLLDQVRLAAHADRSGHASALEYGLLALEAERRCASAELLVLDDFLAAETHTAAELKRLQGLVAQRYDDGQLTAITTNRTARQLKHLLPSLRSRLLSGVQILLDTPGGDRSLA
jgi:DNA replication protein DnaC